MCKPKLWLSQENLGLPTDQLNGAALGGLGLEGLPLKPDFLKNSKATAAAAMDDSVETKRKLESLGNMPAVDMTMAEREASVRDFQVDDDDEEANKMDSGTEKSDEACRFYGRR